MSLDNELEEEMLPEDLLQSHEFRILRHPESRIANVKYTDENKKAVANIIIDFLNETGQVLDETSQLSKVFLIVDKFVQSSTQIDGHACDDLDAMIFFYTNEGAQRIPYKLIVPVEDVEITEEVEA